MTVLPASTLPPAVRQAAVVLLREAGCLEYFADGELPAHFHSDLLVALGPDDWVLGAMLVERMPGSCASVWGPAWIGNVLPIDVRPFLNAVEQRLRAHSVRIIQAFQSPGMNCEFLRDLGMAPITRIWTMRREPHAIVPVVESPVLEFVRQGPVVSPEFESVLLDSFIDSLDCPEWNGLRSTDEILASHRSAAPDLSRWWLATCRGEPAGVLILAAGESVGEDELSYTGIAPRWRGQGFLKSILKFAIRQTRRSSLSLLVDIRNEPAWKVYRQFGFQQVRERELLLGRVQLT